MKTSTKVYLGFTLAALAGSGIAIVLLRKRSLEAENKLLRQHAEIPMVEVECEYCSGQGKKTAVSMEGYGDFEYDCKMCKGTGTRTIPLVEGKEPMWRVM